MSSTDITPPERLLHRKYRRLTQKNLSRLLDKLFAEFTGLRFHVAWALAASHKWDTRALPTACSVCCRIAGTSLKAQPLCRVCGPKQLLRALEKESDGLLFNCRLGVRNYWLPIRVRGVTLGIAYLQALQHAPRVSPTRQQSVRAAIKILGQSEFYRASRLLRLMIQHVEVLDLAELRKTDLTNAGKAVLALEKEQLRLHEAIQRHLPDPPQVACRTMAESHSEQIVQNLLIRLEQDYAHPVTLRKYADQLAMNAAYLSALFSRTVGRPFKSHLIGLRMEKARELLGNSSQNISEIACVVGYASENRFRLAFKKATGLAPRIWRETMQTNPLPSEP